MVQGCFLRKRTPERPKSVLDVRVDDERMDDDVSAEPLSYLERRTVDARANIEAYLADTPPSQRALKFFDWVVEWAESKEFRGCPLQHTVIKTHQLISDQPLSAI